MTKHALILFILILFSACQTRPPEQAYWSGTVTLAEGRPLPLRMYLDLRSPDPSGYFLVSDDRTPIPEIYQNGDSLVIVISEYGAAIRGTWDGTTWKGNFIRYRADTVYLDFSASPESPSANQMPPEEKPGVKLVGTFQVHYQIPDRVDTTSMAKFWARGDSVFGTFIDPSGDHGLMAGVQEGNKARLGRFIGWQANLIELEQQEGTWSGKYYARQFPPQPFVLVPRPSIPHQPLDARRTRMKNPNAPFVFEGITPEGDTVRSTDARFKGKALIVDIMGTWCHNCLDEAPVLNQLYREFNGKGLEIVGLSFEITDDLKIGKKNLDIYRKRHELSFPLLYAGSLDGENVDNRLHSQLEDFFAYPTSVFIDRNGKVHSVHWGFKGPGTGEEYQEETMKFYDTVKKLIP